MPRRKQLDLATFDGKLLDGLAFCRKVYELFDQVQRSPGGTAHLRLRPTLTEKRLVEELLPIARYVQARYSAGRRIKVRWFKGSQKYDAVLLSSGGLVTWREVPRRAFVEVTGAMHKNAHLVRRLLNESGGCFGVKGIHKDKTTGEIVSKPYVFSGDENASDLADQILKSITSKGEKDYPSNTTLIVDCTPNTLILGDEWNDAIERVKTCGVDLLFREVFIIASVGAHSATLYGERRRRTRPSPRKAKV